MEWCYGKRESDRTSVGRVRRLVLRRCLGQAVELAALMQGCQQTSAGSTVSKRISERRAQRMSLPQLIICLVDGAKSAFE